MRALKNTIAILSVLISSCLFGQEPLTQIENFGKNAGNLKMFTYIPENLNTETPVPLVVVIHGCTQSAEMIASETGWNKLADSLNFIVLYPQQQQINNLTKCFNFYLGFDAKKDKGELGSMKEMIDYCLTTNFIDSSKVFVTGMSAGGAMSNALLNAYPQLFNAGALFAAPSKLFNSNKLSPKLQPRVAILHGDDDVVVLKSNAEKIKLQWLKKHQISPATYNERKDYLNNPLLTARLFYNAEKETKVITIYAESVTHKLLISPGNGIKKGGEMDFHTIDINFHSTYWVALFFGLVK